eukprot:15343910-Ditylum_brightwellii.AAC.1
MTELMILTALSWRLYLRCGVYGITSSGCSAAWLGLHCAAGLLSLVLAHVVVVSQQGRWPLNIGQPQ